MFTENQSQILAILINRPDKEYYLSELGEILNKHPGVFQRGVNSLETRGLIKSHRKGNQRLFQINNKHPLFNEIKQIIQKTYGIEGLLKRLVDRLEEVDIALIYGTYAKDRMRLESDIDVLICVTNLGVEDYFIDAITRIEKKVQREINYKIYLKNEYIKKKKAHDAFLEEVFSGKYILLKGTI